jgi:hypothetical protein
MKANDWGGFRDQVLSGRVSPGEALRQLFGYPAPARNDCGYPFRFDFEDAARMHGWGVEGEGPCDYPSQRCSFLAEGRCPFYTLPSEGGTGQLCVMGWELIRPR